MSRNTALLVGTISFLLAGLARVGEAGVLHGVDVSFSSPNPDTLVIPPPLNGNSNVGSAAFPMMSINGDLVKSAFVDTRDAFALGIGANYDDSITPTFDTTNVRALAATAFTVQGVSPVPIPASIRLSGNFLGELFDPLSAADIQLRVYEFDPNDLTGFDGGDFIGMDVVLPFFVQEPAEFTKFRRTSGELDEFLGGGLWTGSETLDFELPASGKGIFVELYGASEIVPELGGPKNGYDFLSTATLDINPPPGVTVTLATGQVFGQSSSVVPEPTALAVWSTLGMCVVSSVYWRRRRNVSAA